MTVQLIGVTLWSLALTAGGRVLLATPFRRHSPFWWGGTALALGIAVALLFRPHEELLGGQDDGAYVNFGARFAREPEWFYRDELLRQVPVEHRTLFLTYGPERPYLSKYATGDVLRDLPEARTGFWFQPAFPIALSQLARLFGPRAVLYGTPLFALMAAFLLWRLAARLLPDAWSGPLAFLFYVGSPFVLWHARSPRSEIVTSFFLLACACLWTQATEEHARRSWLDVALGAVCLFTAPFFHPIGWMVTIPATGIALGTIAIGRKQFWVVPPIGVGALIVYTAQICRVGDPYGLRRLLAAVLARPMRMTLGTGGILATVGLLVAYGRSRTSPRRRGSEAELPRRQWTAGAALLLTYAVGYAVSRFTSPVRFEGYAYHYVYPTDLRTVKTMLSWPVVLAALGGLILLAAQGGPGRHRRWAVLVAAVPCTLLTGVMWDFFMTRYLMVAVAPLVALGLAALVVHIRLPRWTWAARAAAVVALLALGWRNRSHLATAVEYRGLVDFLRPFAAAVQGEHGLMLGEYPRIVAPFEHFFGIPALPIPNEKVSDYRPLEAAWEDVMRAYPHRSAFFLTPYHRPISDRFFFEPVLTRHYRGPRLRQRRWDLPVDMEEWTVCLSLYRMRLRNPETPPDPLPFIHQFDEGHMGLRGFTRPSTKPYDVTGIPLEAGREQTFFLPHPWSGRPLEEVWFFFAGLSDGDSLEAKVKIGPYVHCQKAAPLLPSWHVIHFGELKAPVAVQASDRVTISVSQDTFLADAVVLAGEEAYSLVRSEPSDRQGNHVLAPFASRWARKGAQVCVPIPPGGDGYLLMLVNPVGEPGLETEVGILPSKGEPHLIRTLPAQQWAWCIWRLRTLWEGPTAVWLTLTSNRVYDPQLKGYPPDLIAHLGAIAVVD